MSKITTAASYRGIVVEHAVGASSSGLPQLVAKFRALEQYDEAEKIWIDIQEQADVEITAYLVLFNKNGDPIFHVRDVMKTFEWDGKSLVALNGLDLVDAEVQFEVQDHEYKNDTTQQVANIRGYNEEPGNALKKLDAGELSQLNAKFTAQLSKLAGAPKVASAKAPAAPKKAVATATKAGTKKGNKREDKNSPPASTATAEKGKSTATKATAPKPPAAPTAEAAEATAAEPVAELPVSEAIEEFNTAPKPPAAPKAQGTPAAAPTTAVANDTTTYEGAWAECVSRRAPGVDDETLAAAFQAAMYRIAPNQSEEVIVPGDWTKITDTVLSECGVF